MLMALKYTFEMAVRLLSGYENGRKGTEYN